MLDTADLHPALKFTAVRENGPAINHTYKLASGEKVYLLTMYSVFSALARKPKSILFM